MLSPRVSSFASDATAAIDSLSFKCQKVKPLTPLKIDPNFATPPVPRREKRLSSHGVIQSHVMCL